MSNLGSPSNYLAAQAVPVRSDSTTNSYTLPIVGSDPALVVLPPGIYRVWVADPTAGANLHMAFFDDQAFGLGQTGGRAAVAAPTPSTNGHKNASTMVPYPSNLIFLLEIANGQGGFAADWEGAAPTTLFVQQTGVRGSAA